MKKLSFYLNAAAALMFAFTTTAGLFSCAENGDNPVDPDEPVLPVDPNTIHDGDDLVQIVADATAQAIINGDDEVVVVLPAGVKLIQTETIESRKPLTIMGDADAPAQIALAGGYSPADNLILMNLVYDAAGVGVPFIALNETPNAASQNANGGTSGCYFISNIILDNVVVNDIKGTIIWDGGKKYCVENLIINNSILRLATEDKSVLKDQAWIAFYRGGGVKDLTISNSTVYQVATTLNSGDPAQGDESTYFLRYSSNTRLDRMGYDKSTETQSVNYLNNTFYYVANKGQFGNYQSMTAQKYQVFVVENNIFCECGSGQVPRRILNGAALNRFSADCVFNNNTYWFTAEGQPAGAAETGNSSYDNGYQLATDPDFVAPGVNFTPQGAEQQLLGTGDPRWLN